MLSRMSRSGGLLGNAFDDDGDDPAGAAANLLDLAMVFIVVLVSLISVTLRLPELLDPTSKIAIIKNYDADSVEIVIKDGREVRKLRETEAETSGKGRRVGVAYQLADGNVIYVPDTSE